jgi:WD40 repeat protein
MQFLSSQVNGGKRLLLSSANDGSICLWDINNAAWSKSMNSYVPQQVSNVRFHAQGIFSMHEREGSIIAGSKDRSISVSNCRETGISQVVAWEDAHAGVVKSVRFADPNFSRNVFASAGNDRDINLWDLRQQKRIGAIEEAHASAINSLEWSGELLMSTSFDPSIRLDDLRMLQSSESESVTTSTPKLVIEGHLVPNSKPRGINHPIFIDNGRRVVSGGEKTNLLSVFDATGSGQGTPLSRGTIDFNPSSLHCIEEGELRLLVAAGEGQLCLLRPVES